VLGELPLDINLKHCKACGICYAICPRKALAGDKLGKVYMSDPDKCTKCGICEAHCPDYVIFVRRDKK